MLRSKLLMLAPPRAAFTPIRCMAKASRLTTVEVDDQSGIATLSMNRLPVNALNLDLLRDLTSSIGDIERNKCRGLILTSSNDKVFCAGLDLNELHKPNQERLVEFWTALQDAWLALYLCSMPTAAAINGHAPAGGCLLSTACEYRVMLPNFTIGLNEVLLSYMAPKWVMISFLSVLPPRVAERALNQGKLFSTDAALQAGLVDELAHSKGEALAQCAAFIKSFAQVNPTARALTKQLFRAADVKQLINNRAADLQECVDFINTPLLQQGLGAYFEALKRKSAASRT